MIWSRVPGTTLLQSYPGRGNFSLFSLQNSTNCLQEDREPVLGDGTTRVGEYSRLGDCSENAECGVGSAECVVWSVKFEVWSAKSAVCSVRCGVSREGHGRDRVSLNYRSFMFGKLPPPACPGLCYQSQKILTGHTY